MSEKLMKLAKTTLSVVVVALLAHGCSSAINEKTNPEFAAALDEVVREFEASTGKLCTDQLHFSKHVDGIVHTPSVRELADRLSETPGLAFMSVSLGDTSQLTGTFVEEYVPIRIHAQYQFKTDCGLLHISYTGTQDHGTTLEIQNTIFTTIEAE